MSEKNHPYRTGIITSIVAAAIWSFFPGWTWTAHVISTALSIFTWRIPVWLIVILVGLITILLIVSRSRRIKPLPELPSESINDLREDDPDFCDYVEDRFFDVVWRWGYNRTYDPVNPVSFCPTCDMQLVYHTSRGPYHAAGIIKTYLFCERCDTERAKVYETYRDLVNRIIREVQRKIRNGEYKQLLSS